MAELVRVRNCEATTRRGDVVFIHGLNGNARQYWFPEGEPDKFWPAWLGEDMPDVGVWSLGYENAALKPRRFSLARRFLQAGFAMPLVDRADDVLLRLELEGLGERPLVFVGHSMGGLLIKQLLRSANDSTDARRRAIVERTRGVCFIATPHIGSELARWGTYFRAMLGTNVSMDELRPHESQLRGLNKWYRDFASVSENMIKTLSFYEMKPLSGLGRLVVEPGDADPGVPHAGLHPLDEDHNSICKPVTKSAALYKRILGFIDFECFQKTEASVWEEVLDRPRPEKPLEEVFAGKIIGSYHIKEPVGSGGSGVVFRALHRPSATFVAFKVFYPLKSGFNPLMTTAERAFRGQASMKHPNIVRVLDYGRHKEFKDAGTAYFYIAEELVVGKHLDDWSHEVERQDSAVARRLDVAIRVADALAYAHGFSFIGTTGFQETGLLHGDVKPSNIIIAADDQPKLVDFMIPDLQKLLPSNSDREYRTLEFGTPGFMAPEQCDDGMLTPASDVYSLGITLKYLFFTMFTSSGKLLSEHREADRHVEGGLKALILRMTDVESINRPQTMKEVVSTLESIRLLV